MKTHYLFLFIAFFLFNFYSCTNQNPFVEKESSVMEISKKSTLKSTGNTAEFGDHTIEFVSCEYDATADATTFTYIVTSGTSPSISHWNLEIPAECYDQIEVLYANEDYEVGTDGSTGMEDCLKFDEGYEDGDVRTIIFTLSGEWYAGEIPGLVKAGQDENLGTLIGPICVDPNGGGDTYSISGTTFFDINNNGEQDDDEPGIEGVELTLYDDNGNELETVQSDTDGSYIFEDVVNGDYTVFAAEVVGMVYTLPDDGIHAVTVEDEDVFDVDFGYNLDFSWIGEQSADGYTIGYWKNNIKKALDGKTKGIQIDKETLENYATYLGDFVLNPLNIENLSAAYDILSARGSDPVLLLKKQLMASEFNYANGAYIGDNQLITYFFLYYGEYIILNSEDFTDSDILEAKDWYDAYNNSHGGAIVITSE